MNRKNELTKEYFLREVERMSGADRLWHFFEVDGKVYYHETKRFDRKYVTVGHEASSKGGWQKLRVNIGKRDGRKLIAENKAIYFCTFEELQRVEVSSNMNNGHRCEKLVAMTHIEENPTWKLGGRDRFDKCGDVVVNGLQIQIKFGNASITNVNTLHNAQKDHPRK